jgi:hypothetical protein
MLTSGQSPENETKDASHYGRSHQRKRSAKRGLPEESQNPSAWSRCCGESRDRWDRSSLAGKHEQGIQACQLPFLHFVIGGSLNCYGAKQIVRWIRSPLRKSFGGGMPRPITRLSGSLSSFRRRTLLGFYGSSGSLIYLGRNH